MELLANWKSIFFSRQKPTNQTKKLSFQMEIEQNEGS